VPATIALMVLSAPMISTIYGDKWLSAPLFLTLSVMANLVVLLGNLSYNRLLTATGETKMLMKLNALNLCIVIPLAFLWIPPFGILGVILVGPISGVPGMIVGLYWTLKRYETKADLRNSARILLASTIAGLTTYLFLSTFVASAWIMFTTGVVLFLFVYLISTSIVGAINQMDISNLRVMFSGLGTISKLLEVPLVLIEKSLKIKEEHFKLREQE
jgi:O-antigen/teichoic acid export membrane protein